MNEEHDEYILGTQTNTQKNKRDSEQSLNIGRNMLIEEESKRTQQILVETLNLTGIKTTKEVCSSSKGEINKKQAAQWNDRTHANQERYKEQRIKLKNMVFEAIKISTFEQIMEQNIQENEDSFYRTEGIQKQFGMKVSLKPIQNKNGSIVIIEDKIA